MTSQHGNRVAVLIALTVLTLLVLAASIRYGAIDFSVAEISRALASIFPGQPEPTLPQRIFLELRVPRAIMRDPASGRSAQSLASRDSHAKARA